MTLPNGYVTLYEVAKASDYSVVTFTIRRSILESFRLKHKRYGETSRVMRELLEAYTEGRVHIYPKKGTAKVS